MKFSFRICAAQCVAHQWQTAHSPVSWMGSDAVDDADADADADDDDDDDNK